jgi:hypothetical protein
MSTKVRAGPKQGVQPGAHSETTETAQAKARRAAQTKASDDKRRSGLAAVQASGPAPGEETDAIRGLTRRDETSWSSFRTLARGDFRHDFGENEPSRDKIVGDDENRFFEIAKLVTKKGSVWLRTKFKDNVGTNLFTLIGNKINLILPPRELAKVGDEGMAGGVKGLLDKGEEFLHEDALLESMGIDWKALKEKIKIQTPGVPIEGEPPYATKVVEGGRTYEIRACPYRLGKRGEKGYDTNRAPIDALRIVTGAEGAEPKSFACIVDASGGFPFSDLRNRDLLTGNSGDNTVYIIENLENAADSATKLLPPPILPKKEKDRIFNDAPQLRLLRDTETTVNYPLWANKSDPKSNIYSSLHIILNRTDAETVEANILTKNPNGSTNESYSVSDVSNTSNVKNASLYALAMILEKGVTNEALIYTLIKRMGDWCQALSLLDLDRVYTIANPDDRTPDPKKEKEPPPTTTLRQLQAQGTEIGIVTNDRILLAFSILLGLNVFYTSAMDIAQLIYFKNTLVTADPNALEKRLLETLAGVNVAESQAPIADHMAAINSTRDTAVDELSKEPSLPLYIVKLRALVSNLARLRLGVPELGAQLLAQDTDARNESLSRPKRLSAANASVSLAAKIGIDIQYNTTVLDDIRSGLYPNSRAERIRLDDLGERMKSKGRLSKSVVVTEAKTILKETSTDIQQVVRKVPNLLKGVDILRVTPGAFGVKEEDTNTYATIAEVLSVMPALQLVLAPVQGGGGRRPPLDEAQIRKEIDLVVRALATTTIRVLDPPATVADPPEMTSLASIYRIGDMYYDQTLTGYTVVNEIVITKKDSVAFDRAVEILSEEIPATLTSDATFMSSVLTICQRYILLRIDLALNDLDKIDDVATDRTLEDGSLDETDVLNVGTPGYAKLRDLTSLSRRIESAFASDDPIQAMRGVYTSSDEDADEVAESPSRLRAIFAEFRTAAGDVLLAAGPPAIVAVEGERNETQALNASLYNRIRDNVRIIDGFVQSNAARLRAPTDDDKLSLGTALRAALAAALVERVDETTPTPIPTSFFLEEDWFSVAFATAARQWANRSDAPVSPDDPDYISIKTLFDLHLTNVAKNSDKPPPERLAATKARVGLGVGGGRRPLYAPRSNPASHRTRRVRTSRRTRKSPRV